MSTKSKEETPLMKQYNSVKAKYPGALVLFRVGDFYETFGEDAIKASGILNITLTKRGNGSASEIELAGFPYHSLDTYLPKLVRAGMRVAICDQLEDPKLVKGIVKRGVTELVTPGVVFSEHVLESRQNNFLTSLHFGAENIGLSFLDISTGEFFCSQGNLTYIERLLQGINPSEIIYSKSQKNTYNSAFSDKYNFFAIDDWVYTYDYCYETLISHFNTINLKGFGIDELNEGIIAAGAIIYYLKNTEHHELQHISSISRIEGDKYVWLDKFTVRNLELVNSQFENGVPLINILDATVSPIGSRLLKKWILLPLIDKFEIEHRLKLVNIFFKDDVFAANLQIHLKLIGDLERLISKVAAKRINPREMLHLKKALTQIAPLIKLLKDSKKTELVKLSQLLNPCEFLLNKIDKEIKNEASILVNQGNIINEGVNEELDDLRKISYAGKDYLLQITKREIQRTGISSLKIQYNKVFGYFLEVTNTHKDKVPSDWIRKQTMVNVERYITMELKEYEEKILDAEDKMIAIEQRIFFELAHCALGYIALVQQNAKVVGELDCLIAFGQVAQRNNYVMPKLNTTCAINIKNGRHPVIERQLKIGDDYIPNDVFLDNETQQIVIITGPNMSGKSALLRQTALIVLMAQIGSFVPAETADIGIVDKIFTRVGASDNLSKGESTFMVEMSETASILNNLSERSLILMDEIGRGTSTYDGISIAWAIVEYLHNHLKYRPMTLFATHYHELNELEKELPRVKNYNVSVKELSDKIIFMRKLKRGGAEHSFGIHVAQLAGMPNEVVLRSNVIMQALEKDKIKEGNLIKVKEIPKNNYQMSLFEANDPNYLKIKSLLAQIDINVLSPIEALLKLNEMKSVFNQN